MLSRILDLSVTGIQHRGLSETNKDRLRYDRPMVQLQREPRNSHDPNAIQVRMRPQGVKGKGAALPSIHIGYLRAAVAKELAPLMDTNQMTVARARFLYLDIGEYEGQLKAWVNLSKDALKSLTSTRMRPTSKSKPKGTKSKSKREVST